MTRCRIPLNPPTLTVSQAIRRGLLVVNGPVFVLLIGPLTLFSLLVKWRYVSRDYNWVGVVVFLGSFVLAWLWWSLSVPRWRVWAYERVGDIRELKKQAVAVGLTWPDGHAFGKTEIKSPAIARREQELEPPSE